MLTSQAERAGLLERSLEREEKEPAPAPELSALLEPPAQRRQPGRGADAAPAPGGRGGGRARGGGGRGRGGAPARTRGPARGADPGRRGRGAEGRRPAAGPGVPAAGSARERARPQGRAARCGHRHLARDAPAGARGVLAPALPRAPAQPGVPDHGRHGLGHGAHALHRRGGAAGRAAQARDELRRHAAVPGARRRRRGDAAGLRLPVLGPRAAVRAARELQRPRVLDAAAARRLRVAVGQDQEPPAALAAAARAAHGLRRHGRLQLVADRHRQARPLQRADEAVRARSRRTGGPCCTATT